MRRERREGRRREEILVILTYIYTVILYKYANWNEAHTVHVQRVCVCPVVILIVTIVEG